MKSKESIARFAIMALTVLLVCTILSRNFSTAILPQVKLSSVEKGTLQTTETMHGTCYLGETRPVYAPCSFLAKEVFVKEDELVKGGQDVVSLDRGFFEDQEKELEVSLLQLRVENEYWLSRNAQSALNKRIELAESALERLRSETPENFLLQTAVPGRIIDLQIHPGQKVEKGELLYTYYTTDHVNPYVEFFPENISEVKIGDSFDLEYEATSIINMEEITTVSVVSCRIDDLIVQENGNFGARAYLQEFEGIRDRQEVKITIVSEAKVYDQIVPLTAISENGNDLALFILRTRDGLFGEEFFAQEVKVKELARNRGYIALLSDSLPGTEVITYTTGSLHDGQQVRVME